jgi:hypothetical protein
VFWPQGFGGRFDVVSALIASAAAIALFDSFRGGGDAFAGGMCGGWVAHYSVVAWVILDARR